MQEQRVPLIDVQLVLEMLCREPNAERQAAYSELIKARNAFRDTGTTDRWARCVQTARQYEGLTPAIIWVRLKTFLKSYFYKFSIARLVGRVTGREPTP